MKLKKNIISIASEHIERGIKKYDGKIDAQLEKLIQAAGLTYTPYLFNDGRILLVLPNSGGAFLYASKEVLYNALSLT